MRYRFGGELRSELLPPLLAWDGKIFSPSGMLLSYHNLTITACIRMTCRLGYVSHLQFLEVLHSNAGSLRKVSFIVTQPSSLYIVRVGLSGVFRGYTHPEPIQGPASTETGSQLDPRVHNRTRRRERTHGLAHQSPIRGMLGASCRLFTFCFHYLIFIVGRR